MCLLPLMDIPPNSSLSSLDSELPYPSYLPPRESKTRRLKYSVLPPQCEEKTAIHAIQCWIFDGYQPPDTRCGEISESDVKSWFCRSHRGPRSDKNKPASAGLVLLCRQQQTSGTSPFKTDTLGMINETLGLPKAYAYLNTRGAGVSGHYLEIPNEPGLVE